ncbi:MAG: hypothetical protein AAGA99_03215 [Actinomycetota bacterium]
MSPLLSLGLAAGIIVVGSLLVLAWHRFTSRRQRDGIAAFEREMRALAPDERARSVRRSTSPLDDSGPRPPGGVSPGP